MAKFEYEFSNKDKDLVLSQQFAQLSDMDYIRIIVYPTEGIDNIVRLPGTDNKAIFYSSLSPIPFSINVSPFYSNVDTISVREVGGAGIHQDIPYNKNDFKIYTNNNNIFIKPNDIFEAFELPQGNYKIQVDFLNQVVENIPDESNLNVDTSYLQGLPFPRYLEEFDLDGDGFIFQNDASHWGVNNRPYRPDIQSFIELMLQGGGENALASSQFIFPEEFYNPGFTLDSIQSGGVDAQPIENFYNPSVTNIRTNFQFIIKQISTSRKEVRLKLLDKNIISNSNIITDLTNEFNNGNNEYQFKHTLNIGTGDHIPIMNYAFDKFTDGRNNQSLILKLYEPLSISVENLSLVTIEKEILTTQVEDIFYFSDVPDVFFGDGLSPQPQEDWINSVNNEIGFQNYNELTGSLDNISLDNLISSSDYNYPNLNTDFSTFENHTFFGSAKKKLVNFKKKVETIQSYYTDISSSLVVSSSIDGDSPFITEYRKNLFKKINDEIKTFTPYERFLYYDGQNESTASAPGLGKNYTDTIPVTLSGEGIDLGSTNGFTSVYKHSSEKVSGTHNQFIDLFTDKYKVENKPFFNYSGSIYLSFLLQGDSGSLLTWGNRNQQNSPPLPFDTFYQNNILNPNIGDISSSKYRRYIFEASQSYFVPNEGSPVNSELQNVSDYGLNSEHITVLHGRTKEADYQIIDSTGNYPTTVVTASGAPFFGSVMPAGELFRIYYQNTLSSSLQGYWNIDDVTSGSGLVDADVVNGAGPTFGDGEVNKQVSASSGVEVHGRQYGSSYFMISESSSDTGIQIESSNYNFNKDDNFSLSIWAKRFHPTSIDPHDGNVQGIFTRGVTENSYGIDYNFFSGSGNKIRAGVRPGDSGTRRVVEFNMTDSGSNWHHYVMTYESASGTGVKLYVDGVLRGSTTSITDGDGVIMGDFSSSAVNTSDEKLTIGGNDVVSGNGRQFNGFLQYPRIYNRTITAEEVNSLYLNPSGITETKITDVKITRNNPSNVLPFDNIYKTTSTEWNNWYNDLLTKAENFDTDNIHSFENNLPLYIQESSEYNEMKDFLNLQGEQYDLIRNHIDSLGTIHNRGYKESNSPPENILPILLNNIGYESINPFAGNLNETLGSYLTDVTSIDDIKNQTWKKTLNNLLYVYKSKGTKNAVRGLLNVYGYPPDLIQFQEFGGSTNDVSFNDGEDTTQNPMFSNQPPPPPAQAPPNHLDLNSATGSVGFQVKTEKLYNYSFSAKDNRKLNLNWWMEDANADTIEFIYKHRLITNSQTILKSSGSGAETLWDLRVKPSSDGASSSFEFRLNNSQRGDTAIANRGYSMSLDYSPIGQGEIVNIMLQRITGSIDQTGIQEYRLHSAFQNGKVIETYNYVTMSVSGGLIGDSTDAGKGFFANDNFIRTGSRHYQSSSNLVVGENFSGSLAEIRTWSSALSKSKFEQHTFNKFAAVGNDVNSYKNELIYRFKLNENYVSSSVSSSAQTFKIVDSSPSTTFKDYSFNKSGTLFNTSSVYGFNYIDVVRLTLQDNISKPNDNNIFINPRVSIVGNLSSQKSALGSLYNPSGDKPLIKTSNKLELYRSPQTFVNNFILDNLSGFNLEKLYGNPINYYSQSYGEFDTFRKNFFDAHEIKIDTNKFIRAHENMFNDSITEALETIIPARSTFGNKSSVGVEIKPTILEKQKYENENHSVETNPHLFSASINPVVEPPIVTQEKPKSGSISSSPVGSGSLGLPYTASIGRGYIPFDTPSDISSSLKPSTTGSGLILPISTSISTSPVTTNSEVILPKSGSFDNQSAKSFVNIHDSWGTDIDATHFINFAAPTSSNNDFNVLHIDTRNTFLTIGDTEIYSGSKRNQTDFTNFRNFYNRRYVSGDVHSGVTYESYINGNPGNQTGRMIGKTLYYFTGSDGSITLPSNHVDRYSYPFNKTMYEGTQNVNPGLINGDDLSTASFYSVKVTGGEQAIYVKGTNNPTKGGGETDKIIY